MKLAFHYFNQILVRRIFDKIVKQHFRGLNIGEYTAFVHTQACKDINLCGLNFIHNAMHKTLLKNVNIIVKLIYFNCGFHVMQFEQLRS